MLPEMNKSRRESRFPVSYYAFVATVIGVLMLLAGMNPALRGNSDEDGTRATIDVVGQSLTWTGSAVMAYRSWVYARRLKHQQARDANEQHRITGPFEKDVGAGSKQA
jgi:Ni,Fe-hydrogenase I cytochrome b subunit